MIAKLLTEKTVRRIAGATYFNRGEEYFHAGCVHALKDRNGRVTASVQGNYDYDVALWDDGGTLEFSCTCPLHEGDGDFCKHCVATALAWLRRPAGKSKSAKTGVTEAEVRHYLLNQKKEVLADLLLDWAHDDERLWNRLELHAAEAGGKTVNIDTYRELIDRAMRVRGYVDYRAAYGFVHGMRPAIDALDALLTPRQAAALMELCEYAIAAAGRALEHMDDSDGHMSGVFDRLRDLHLGACVMAKPDPEALAQRLFNLETADEWDVFYGAARTYARALGKRGLARYRALAETEWNKIKPLTPAHPQSGHDQKRSHITGIMQTLAELSGDVEAQVDIIKPDLSHSYAYLRIAQLYSDAKQRDRALDWAERGLKAFADRPDDRLEDFVAAEYRRRKRHDEAVALTWKQFDRNSCLSAYEKLKSFAQSARQWPVWRERALETIRREAETQRAKYAATRWPGVADHSLLVEIHLSEKDADAAWREANNGGCTRDLWLTLAQRREADQPQDALAVYRRLIEPIVNEKNNTSYQRAAELLRKVRTLMNKSGQGAEFAQYLATLRATHKPKRNFIALLDGISNIATAR